MIVDGSTQGYVDAIGALLDEQRRAETDRLIVGGRHAAAQFSRPQHARSVIDLMASLTSRGVSPERPRRRG